MIESKTDSCVLNPEECYSCPNCRLSANGLENVNQDVTPSQERIVNIVSKVSYNSATASIVDTNNTDNKGLETNIPNEEEGEENVDENIGGVEVDEDEGYISSLEDRSRPTIPQADPSIVRSADSDGWELIARLGAMESFLSSFPALQDVPEQHHQAWVR